MENTTKTDLLYNFQQATLDERRWFELYLSVLNYGENVEHNLDTRHRDNSAFIDDTLQYKEQLLSQWRLFNHVFDSLPFSILFLDDHYQILHYNKKATPLYYQAEFQQFLTCLNQTSVQNIPQQNKSCHNSFTKEPALASPHPTNIGANSIDSADYRSLRWENGIYTYHLSLLAYHEHPQVKYIVYAYRNKPQLNPTALMQLFALTEAECHTLQALLEYSDSKIVAERLAISHETVRTHLKKILQKTQTHSQTELMLKLFSGSYWLSEIQALHHFDNQDNKQLINDLVHEAFILLGSPELLANSCSSKSPHLTLMIPSFFGVVWDFIEDNGQMWQDWCDNNNNPLLIVNTQHIIPKADWKTQDLPTLCQTIAKHLQDYLSQTAYNIKNLTIVGIHTGVGFALNLPQFLPYAIDAIKLVSPILPLPYMDCEQLLHREYHSAKKAQKTPKKIWHTIMPHVIESATKDTQTYFQKRLDYQQHEIDKQKVRRWLNHPYLGEMFANHCKLANHKIAFDVLLVHRAWQFPIPTYPVLCYAGRQDIYTSIDSLHAFANVFETVQVVILEEEYYSLSIEAWQAILS